ncbi:MAG: phosphoribosylformylglycinamidine cyclo-ligase, partial [Thermoleophilia bacterium]|nr:phosphoribosylformylglycinamidine cyclo-ligase [Thermoleophilia bacterium]
MTYAAAGVDIAAGEEAVRLIKAYAESTYIPGVLGSLGGFAAMYEMPRTLEKPVLVTATDGVGTKVLLAQETGRLDTVGIDLVAMSVNDVLTVGARPVLFLDYIALGKLVPHEVAEIVRGVAEGCRQAGCALVGGEMAEMPGLYSPGEFDLAGFCVGVAEKDRLIDGSQIREGDAVIGL